MSLPRQREIQDQFDAKAKEGISPCQWMPSTLDEVKKNNWSLVDNCSEADILDNNAAALDRINQGDRTDPQALPESLPNDHTWPHPFADTSHIDETQFNQEDYKRAVAAFKDKDNPGLERLNRIVGPESPGMKRLARIFEWTLYRTTQLLTDINDALVSKTQPEKEKEKEYTTARDNYLLFLRDLDDHEPQAHNRELNVKDKQSHSGYGKAMKWVCIDPVILKGQIYGARVVIKWNPHSSSNGIPIKHTP